MYSQLLGLDALNGLNPNGSWVLFLADLSGGGQSTITSWDLDITAVPEPANVAMGTFAGVFVLVGLCRSARVREFLQRSRAA